MYKTFVTIPRAVPDKLCDEMVKESSKYTEHLAGVMWKKEADLKKIGTQKLGGIHLIIGLYQSYVRLHLK